MSIVDTEMPPEVSRCLFEAGAFLIMKDFPEGYEFGIDYKSWNTGPKFLGIKMIPPGVHFVYVSSNKAPRIAFFHVFEPKEILYKKWDVQQEDLSDYIPSGEEISRIRANLKEIDGNLGPYPYSTYQQWISLSSSITPKTVERLAPRERNGRISSQTELVTEESAIEQKIGDPKGISTTDREHPNRLRFIDESGLPLMHNASDSEIRFSDVPQVSLAETNLKRAGIDSSDRLMKLLEKLEDQQQFIGEFQYAFVVFLMGQVYEGFRQWKRFIHIICSCTSALKTHTNLFAQLLMALHFQLKTVEDDFFEDVLAKDNFLIATLSLLFANIQDTDGVDETFKKKAAKFKALLENRYKRSFDLL